MSTAPATPAGRGRPPAASRELLQEAAFELFLENGYAGTTVDQISQRAGVSRNTFFNYFEAKGDVFWVKLDDTIDRLGAELEAAPQTTPALAALRASIMAIGAELGPARVPFALTQHQLIGSVHELQASALGRFTRQARLIQDFLGTRGFDELGARVIAYATLGAIIAAGQAWAAAGTNRGALEPYLARALDPLLSGFELLEP